MTPYAHPIPAGGQFRLQKLASMSPKTANHSIRILLVSPQQEIGIKRDQLLVAAGYTTRTATTVDDAIALLESEVFDAVVAGQMLPLRDKNRLIHAAYEHGVPTIALHVLPTDESIQAEAYVRVTEGADGLLAAIAKTTQRRKIRALCRPASD